MHVIQFPFVRETYSGFDGEGYSDVPTWRPGVRFENVGPEDSGAVADGIGKAAFTVVAVFKPGRFPTRVFFTRQFESPEGATFGKGKLHIVTLDKFRRLTRGYQHPYGIGEPLPLLARWNEQIAREMFEAMLAEHAQAIEARQGGDPQGLHAQHESAVAESDAPETDPASPPPSTTEAG